MALYTIDSPIKPHPSEVSFRMESSFSEWMSLNFGEQEMMWGKVVATTIRILSGEPQDFPVKLIRENQTPLWQWIARLPDGRDFIEDRMRKFWG